MEFFDEFVAGSQYICVVELMRSDERIRADADDYEQERDDEATGRDDIESGE